MQSKSTPVCPCSVPDCTALYRDMVDGGFPFNVLSTAMWRERPQGHSEMQTSAECPGVYPIQVSCFPPRMGNVIVVLMNNKYSPLHLSPVIL